MKRIFASILILMFVLAGVSMAAEVYKPGKTSGSSIGTSGKPWGSGYYDYLYGVRIQGTPDFTHAVASRDFGTASTQWTLSETEARASIIYKQNGAAGTVIVLPSTNRIYHFINNDATTVTVKKSGGTGVLFGAYAQGVIAYMTQGATTDYFIIGATGQVLTSDRL